jgi:hypothetical protein
MSHQVTDEEMEAISISQVLASEASVRGISKKLVFEYDIKRGVETFVVINHGKRMPFKYIGSAIDAYNAI